MQWLCLKYYCKYWVLQNSPLQLQFKQGAFIINIAYQGPSYMSATRVQSIEEKGIIFIKSIGAFGNFLTQSTV